MKTIAGVALIVLGAVWSCGESLTLGFEQPDEEDLNDVWTEELYDGDISGELEFQTDDVYIKREEEPLVETERGTYELTPSTDDRFPSIEFTPTGDAPYVEYIKFYDPTSLTISGNPDEPYDPDFPEYYR